MLVEVLYIYKVNRIFGDATLVQSNCPNPINGIKNATHQCSYIVVQSIPFQFSAGDVLHLTDNPRRISSLRGESINPNTNKHSAPVFKLPAISGHTSGPCGAAVCCLTIQGYSNWVLVNSTNKPCMKLWKTTPRFPWLFSCSWISRSKQAVTWQTEDFTQSHVSEWLVYCHGSTVRFFFVDCEKQWAGSTRKGWNGRWKRGWVWGGGLVTMTLWLAFSLHASHGRVCPKKHRENSWESKTQAHKHLRQTHTQATFHVSDNRETKPAAKELI